MSTAPLSLPRRQVYRAVKSTAPSSLPCRQVCFTIKVYHFIKVSRIVKVYRFVKCLSSKFTALSEVYYRVDSLSHRQNLLLCQIIASSDYGINESLLHCWQSDFVEGPLDQLSYRTIVCTNSNVEINCDVKGLRCLKLCVTPGVNHNFQSWPRGFPFVEVDSNFWSQLRNLCQLHHLSLCQRHPLCQSATSMNVNHFV